ncbi:cyanophycin synthetase [Paracoccus cavernae]|uniref:Cyanophycin synthetase n=1 Tax=Paracoccus cavernae TaxID=1571207 RepID=A0ABT8D3C8_9RHOB|nr:cyanophycin synthetase [Paracoccus cavernae]
MRVFDDFAHHPSEVAASIAVLREGAAGRLIAVFEPQLHSRVSRMALRFAEALSAAELSFILPVAAHGERAGSGRRRRTESRRAVPRAFCRLGFGPSRTARPLAGQSAAG